MSPRPTPFLTRSASLTGYVDLARAVGLDPYRMATAQGLPPACLTDPDLMIPASAVGRLLETSAARSGAADFGLRLAETRNLSNLGALGLVMREQPTLRAAIEITINYIWAQNQALSLRLETAGEIAIIRTSIGGPRPNSSRQSTEMTVAVMVRTFRRLLAGRWRPEAITFAHAAPPDLATHRRVLGMAPTFGQQFDGVVLSIADLDAPIADADPVNAQRLERYIEALGWRSNDPVETARELIQALLPTGACSAARVAQHMGIDRRTLHRRLAGAGTNFRTLIEETRERLAAAHIAAGDRSLTEIADLLGYSSLSAFSRWRRARPLATRA
jgi:AraC-like DNA-binding protein